MPIRLFPPIPADTAQAAEAVLGDENPFIKLGRQIDALVVECVQVPDGKEMTCLDEKYPVLALATILQFMEKLTDGQMEFASCTRLDIKYALHLPLHYPGISRSRLCDLRQAMYCHPTWCEVFQRVIDRLLEADLIIKREGVQITTEQILDEICAPSRVEGMMNVMQLTIEAAAARDSEWLRSIMKPNWFKRFTGRKIPRQIPLDRRQQEELVVSLGNDMQYFLFHASSSSAVCGLPEIQNLRTEWIRQFEEIPNYPPVWRKRCCAQFT